MSAFPSSHIGLYGWSTLMMLDRDSGFPRLSSRYGMFGSRVEGIPSTGPLSDLI